ncbi:hypothetical protein DY000_02014788 [Brassica cretica]|uniref:Uncharacterized protein n=1 Tax=Brassica cretica TaxID=69181 RepID=A0ABQ7CMD9_BRACR|nr:hypothetical protein DY000_02014788 [Brassica cretica]
MISPAKAINIILEPAKAMVQCYQVSNYKPSSSLTGHAAIISPSQQFRSLCCNRHETTLVKGHDSPPMTHDRGHSYPSRDHILMVQSLINANQVSITRSLWNGRCNASVHHTIRTGYPNHDPAPSSTTISLDHITLYVVFKGVPCLARTNSTRYININQKCSHPWNSHETSFYTSSAFKAVLASKSGVWPSPFSPDYLRVFLRHRGSQGRVHP